jgi:molecular chaperone GrpE
LKPFTLRFVETSTEGHRESRTKEKKEKKSQPEAAIDADAFAGEATTKEAAEEEEALEERISEAAQETPRQPHPDLKLLLYIKELEAKVAGYESKIDDVREYVKKMESEIEQIRSRAERDLQKNIEKKISEFFQRILPIVDNFERSLMSAEPSNNFVEGIRLIHQQLEEVLRKSELSRMKTKGELFDPSVHDAVTTFPVETDDQDDRVIEEMKAGYKYHDTVVRPAQVVVGKKVSAQPYGSEDPQT